LLGPGNYITVFIVSLLCRTENKNFLNKIFIYKHSCNYSCSDTGVQIPSSAQDRGLHGTVHRGQNMQGIKDCTVQWGLQWRVHIIK